jgi:hypothetical protein
MSCHPRGHGVCGTECHAIAAHVDVLSYTVYPLGHGTEAERLADALEMEQEGHARTLDLLAEVTRERDTAKQLVADLRQSARVARQQTADTVAAGHDTATALANALRERDAARAAQERAEAQRLREVPRAADRPMTLAEKYELRSRAERAERQEAERADALGVLETAAREVLRVAGQPTTLDRQEAYLGQLRVALEVLRAALPTGEVASHG